MRCGLITYSDTIPGEVWAQRIRMGANKAILGIG